MMDTSNFDEDRKDKLMRDAALCKPTEESIPKTLRDWSPYTNNGGNVVAVAGPKFCIIAGDTRLSEGYSILSRNTTKLVRLAPQTYLATSGMYADFVGIQKVLKARITAYEFSIGKPPGTESLAQLVAYQLYMKRFFPFYTFNLVAGLDANGDGAVYGYDAVGSFNKLPYGVQGSGQGEMVPILDNQLIGYNKVKPNPPTTAKEVEELIVDAFTSVAERDIYSGDGLEVIILEHGKEPRSALYPLRRD